ncbi:MAG: hypothetical protein ACRDEA_09175 [Microcystaceae cyanobacterium]
MLDPADRPDQFMTSKDLSLAASLGQQANLLKQFYNSCDRSVQRVLSLCEWTISPGNSSVQLLEVNCFSYGSWRQILEKNLKITIQLRQVVGATANITVRCTKPVPPMRHVGYFFNPYRDD